MKKGILALVLTAALLFAACAPIQKTDFNGTALQAASEKYTQNLIDGDFEAVAKNVAPSAAPQLTADVLKQAWEDTTAPAGTFERIAKTDVKTDFSTNGNTAVVTVTCDFTAKSILIQYTYNANSEIGGLWLNYAPKVIVAESTDTYTETDVSTKTDRPLPGILTLPRNVEQPPVVLMIQGSGAHDMNETVGTAGNHPFADIAHGLAEHGIASLRYNKRTAQYPQTSADPQTLTIEYEVLDDAAAAVELLRDMPEVNTQRIYVLGHSLGGMLAPKIAQDNDLNGLVSLAGSPRSLLAIMLDQSEAAAAAEQITPQELAQTKAVIEIAKNAKQGDLTPMLGVTGNYWYSLNRINTPEIAQSLDIPMLFLQGEADFQVSPAKDFEAWKTLLAEKPSAEFLSYPALTHLFTPAPESPTDTVADYNAPQTVDPQVITDIAAWISKN